MSSTASIQQVLARTENTVLVRDLLADPAIRTRNSLAKEVCQRLALRDPRGALQIATTAKALRDLEAQGVWKLPPPTKPISKRWMPQRVPQRVPPPAAVPPRVEAVRGLHLLEATTEEHLKLWNELILREHPLHECRLVGRQLRYLVGSDRAQTIRRMKHEAAVLIVQDTMELNYSNRKACAGLGVVGSNQTGAESRGLDLHTCLAVGAKSGLPLGGDQIDRKTRRHWRSRKGNFAQLVYTPTEINRNAFDIPMAQGVSDGIDANPLLIFSTTTAPLPPRFSTVFSITPTRSSSKAAVTE